MVTDNQNPHPLTMDDATRAAYVDYATALLGPSEFHARLYDGALECAETWIATGVRAPHRWATEAELAAVIEQAEQTDDAQYASAESAKAVATYRLQPRATGFGVPASLHFLAVLAAAGQNAGGEPDFSGFAEDVTTDGGSNATPINPELALGEMAYMLLELTSKLNSMINQLDLMGRRLVTISRLLSSPRTDTTQ